MFGLCSFTIFFFLSFNSTEWCILSGKCLSFVKDQQKNFILRMISMQRMNDQNRIDLDYFGLCLLMCFAWRNKLYLIFNFFSFFFRLFVNSITSVDREIWNRNGKSYSRILFISFIAISFALFRDIRNKTIFTSTCFTNGNKKEAKKTS